jgi:hypothetical protein
MLALSTSALIAKMVPDLRIRYASLAWTPLLTAVSALMQRSVMLVTPTLLSSIKTDNALIVFLDGHQQLLRLQARIANAMILLTFSAETNAQNAMISFLVVMNVSRLCNLRPMSTLTKSGTTSIFLQERVTMLFAQRQLMD